jgi:hypothetical protein
LSTPDSPALLDEVSELFRDAQGGAAGGERRAAIAQRLSELRQLYRRNPSAFSTEVLAMLR